MIDKITQTINKLSIQECGIHVVSEWSTGPTDGVGLAIHTKEEILKEFPNTPPDLLDEYLEGKKEGFIIDKHTDDEYPHAGEVTTKIYFPTDFNDEKNELIIVHPDDEIIINFRHLSDIEKFYEIRNQMRAMPITQLYKFMRAISTPLSSTDLGEGQAFKLMAFIESIGIEVLKERAQRKDG